MGRVLAGTRAARVGGAGQLFASCFRRVLAKTRLKWDASACFVPFVRAVRVLSGTRLGWDASYFLPYKWPYYLSSSALLWHARVIILRHVQMSLLFEILRLFTVKVVARALVFQWRCKHFV